MSKKAIRGDSEALQRMIAEEMFAWITHPDGTALTSEEKWQRYVARAPNGVQMRPHPAWPRGRASLRIGSDMLRCFLPRPPVDELPVPQSRYEASELAHNEAVLPRIPKSEKLPANDPLSKAVREHGRPGMAYRFFSEQQLRSGMLGYALVKDAADKPVRVGTLFMAEIDEATTYARGRYLADLAEQNVRELNFRQVPEGEPTQYLEDPRWADVVRVSWLLWRWRAVAALYLHVLPDPAPVTSGLKTPMWRRLRFGIDFVTQWKGGYWRQRTLRFYRVG